MKVNEYIPDERTLVELAQFEQSDVGQRYLAALQKRIAELQQKLERPRIVREGDFSEDAMGQLMTIAGIKFAMSMIRDAKTALVKIRSSP